MSKAKTSREKRSSQASLSRVTRSSLTQGNPREPGLGVAQRNRPSDSGLASELSHMSVNEQAATLARKWRPSKVGSNAVLDFSSSIRPHQSSSSGSMTKPQPTPRGGLGPIARMVKLGRLQNIVVVAGAGISTASGIPDFRTPGTGLYANLKKYDLPYPEAIFNIDYFSNDPRPFFSLAKELYPGRHRPNYVHYFIRMLHQKGLLLRMYTQNIDGLEKMCGIPEDKLVEAHGSFATASCHLCYTPFPAEEAKRLIMTDNIPKCSFCEATVKPDVVFFGEDLPQSYFQHTKDFPEADLLMIMGTSLQIEPFASLVNTVKSSVPRLLLNRNAVGPFERKPLRRGDYMELGDLVDSVRKFAEILGWHSEIEDLMTSQENREIGQLMHCLHSGNGLQMNQPLLNSAGRRGAAQQWDKRPPKSRPGAPGPSDSGGEESDSSETDSKSTESSGPSN
ncbi:NAD-dependent protein deacetylase sirtuin-3 [Chanos chanos]|uniref:NAD-dependent protein deacetylase sirtuin-3 n=1 Tax=Chanos chanos TaxID=29144 RepID=A0A6J2WRK4_CHACN|nr:NAD-dependent protein deacetylase sirtuin-3-like [Chanos chanos]